MDYNEKANLFEGENAMYLDNYEGLIEHINSIEINPNERLMILIGEESSGSLDKMREYLNSNNVKFFGGIYSRLLVGNKSFAEGFIVEKFEPVYCSVVLPFLMRYKLKENEVKGCTALVLVDGLTSQMRELADTIFDKVGNNVKYIGGGAGFYDMVQRPCIFDNDGTYKDVLYLCIIKANADVAVRHGWNKLDGPYTITKSYGNILSQLNDYNAFEVYRDVIEDAEDMTLSKEDFFTYAKDHPFGVSRKGKDEFVVRDPIALNGNKDIICVANIHQGRELYFLKGNVDTLLASSLQIAEYCASKAPEKYVPLLFDCISRAMFMEERFNEELNNIQGKLKNTVYGALSIGEISSDEEGAIVIHNKSTILGIIEM